MFRFNLQRAKALILLVLCFPVWAQPDIESLSPQEAGRALADFAEEYHAGWGDMHSKGRLILIDAQGKETPKELETFTLERNQKQDGRAIIIYDKDGTALITYAYKNKPDNQWAWFPGMRRKYRIKAANESNAFLGSEFSYEDLRSQYPDKYDFELLREETLNGEDCWVLKRLPRHQRSAYSHHLAWMDQRDYRIMKVEYFNKQGVHFKTSVASEWGQHDQQWWNAKRTHTVNHLTGRASTILVDELEYGLGYSSKDFKAGMGILR